MLRNSEGCVLPSYFSGTSGLKFFVLGHWTRRSSRVNAGQPAAYGKSPGSPGARASTAFPALWSDCRRVSRRRSIVVRASSCRRASRTWRWSRRSRGADGAVESSSALFPRGGFLCFRGGECTVVAPPAVLSPSAFVFSTCRGREVVGRCGVSLLAKAIRLWMVALQSSALSAAGGKSRSSCALVSASAGVEGSGGERREERDMLGLLTALEGAGSRPGVFALLVPGRWSGASREPPVCPWPSKRMPPPVTWRWWVVVCWDGRGSSTETEARSSALSLDLVAPRASSPATTLPTTSPPPTAGSGSGGRDADGPATSEAFFFGAMVLLLMKNAPVRTLDQVRTTSTPPTWRAKDVGGNCPPRAPMGPGPLRLSGERAEGARRADRGKHTGGLPRFGPRWTRKTLLLLGCIELGSSGARRAAAPSVW